MNYFKVSYLVSTHMLFLHNNLIINFKFNTLVLRKYNWVTTLVVQRLRMDLPTQGTRV